MKLPIRLENAITKLYTAFHEGKLDAMDCKMCAVGNICDNNDSWMNYTGNSVNVNNDGIVTGVYAYPSERLDFSKNGYNEEELYNVERIFLTNWISKRHDSAKDKETQFKGLCAVVEYLCKLDNIPNVMDYTKLFETENNKPKYQLNTI